MMVDLVTGTVYIVSLNCGGVGGTMMVLYLIGEARFVVLHRPELAPHGPTTQMTDKNRLHLLAATTY